MKLCPDSPMEFNEDFGPCKMHGIYMGVTIYRAYHCEDKPRALYFAYAWGNLVSAKNTYGIEKAIREARP